jgi:hypothetical protein
MQPERRFPSFLSFQCRLGHATRLDASSCRGLNPAMRSTSAILLVLFHLALGLHAETPAPAGTAGNPDTPAPNTLSPAEKAAGWRLLFDGHTTQGWRGFKQSTFPNQGWVIENGLLIKQPRVRGGDIVTTDTFLDFELTWEWRIRKGGNNGVKYFITEERGSAVGHEYQMIDDTRVQDPKGMTAAFYAILPPSADKPPPRIDDWNQSRILVQGQRVEHWLNGLKVLEYELGSPIVLAAVARSKFKNVAGFGTKLRGHILLTDHTDEAHFRNLKIRELPAD